MKALQPVLRGIIAILLLVPGAAHATDGARSSLHPVQIPYSAPPRPESAPNNAIPPNTEPLSPKEIKRAEALLPLLSGNQEFWAMGEFVHLGRPVLPVLVKALKMPDPRLRYNAIETMSMIKGPSAASALVESAMEPHELVRVREHALRVAVRLNPGVTLRAIQAMAKDSSDSIRKVAAFEGRHVRVKAVIPVLIGLVNDEQRFVSNTAIESLLKLTRRHTELHDWEISKQQDREDWAQEWTDWWDANKDTFVIPEPRKRRRPL